METLNGIDYVLGIERDGAFLVVAGQTEASIKRSSETVDTTTKDSDGWEEVEPGIKAWETSTDGLQVLEDTGFDVIEEAYMTGEKLTIKVARKQAKQTGKAKIYTGKCVITGLDDSFGMKDKVSYSISLKGTGPLTITKEAVPEKQVEEKEILEGKGDTKKCKNQ